MPSRISWSGCGCRSGTPSSLKAGDPIRIDGDELGTAAPRFGKIGLVYPQIEDGRVVADAIVEGLGDYFVGERVRVWICGR